MAFAFFNLFEPSIVKNIYDFALIEPALARVLFQNHPMLPPEEFFIMLPNERATVGELQEEMRQMERFKKRRLASRRGLWLMERMRIYTPMSS